MSRPQGATLTQRRFAAAASGAFDAAFPAQESQSRRDLPIRNESSQPLPVHVTATAVSCVWAHPWPAPPCPRIPVRGRPVAESPARDRVCAVPSPLSCIPLSLSACLASRCPAHPKVPTVAHATPHGHRAARTTPQRVGSRRRQRGDHLLALCKRTTILAL